MKPGSLSHCLEESHLPWAHPVRVMCERAVSPHRPCLSHHIFVGLFLTALFEPIRYLLRLLRMN